MRKTYVLDTNVLLTDFNSLFSFDQNDIIIPLKVVEEIDKHKKRQDGVGINARATIRILDSLRASGNLYKGVKLGEQKGILSIKSIDLSDIPDNLEKSDADNQIIATAIKEAGKYKRKKVILVSRDLNMRVKCDALNITSEDYVPNRVINNVSDIYSGFIKHLVDDQVIDQFYSGEEIYLEKEEIELSPHQFIMLVSNQNEKKTALAKFFDYNSSLQKIREFKEGIWGLRPRNKEQMFALNLLMDENIPVITLTGKAGCGKTLLAIASGLDLVLEKKKYNKLVVSRPVQPMGKDIGYLPGTLEDKMAPWLKPIQDNLEFLMSDSKVNADMCFENGTIEIEAITYIRGRSISNAFIIIDEAQNLTKHELKTIITRVGENTKIILTGDIEQIDNIYLDETSNGLSYAIERFREYNISAHMPLLKGERSKVATLAANAL